MWGRTALAMLAIACAGCRARVAPMPGDVGAQCANDDDCVRGLSCMAPMLDTYAFSSRCSRPCASDDECPSGSRCGPFSVTAEAEATLGCVPSCDRTGDVSLACAAGDACDFDGVCFPFGCAGDFACTSDRCDEASGQCAGSGASPDAHSGDPCTSSDECRPPLGACILGHCVHRGCDRGGAYACAFGEICVAEDAGLGETADVLSFLCERPCTPGVDAISATEGGACHDGEICIPPEADPLEQRTTGFCDWLVEGFPHPSSTARVGDPCTSYVQCPGPLGYGACQGGRCTTRFCSAAALDGVDVCGADAFCFHGPMAPAFLTRSVAAVYRAGFCARHCMGGAACPTGLMCDPTTEICLP